LKQETFVITRLYMTTYAQ